MTLIFDVILFSSLFRDYLVTQLDSCSRLDKVKNPLLPLYSGFIRLIFIIFPILVHPHRQDMIPSVTL